MVRLHLIHRCIAEHGLQNATVVRNIEFFRLHFRVRLVLAADSAILLAAFLPKHVTLCGAFQICGLNGNCLINFMTLRVFPKFQVNSPQATIRGFQL